MKHLILVLFTVLLNAHCSFTQDWKPYNDTLVYFYQASNTGDFFTLRTRSKTIVGEETKIHFVDNYIPCDTAVHPDGFQLYYAQSGSILGDSMVFVNDTLSIDNTVQFVNSMSLGESLPFSIVEGTEITYVSTTDSIIFETTDSVKYYSISDGTQLIQSKNFGLIKYPKQNSDSLISYELVGIEYLAGLSFDHHNEIFNFEIGDKFYYESSYFSVFFYEWGSDNHQLEVLDKYEIDGHYFYDVIVRGGFVSNYPQSVLENSIYDYPGEPASHCRGCDGLNSIAWPYLMGDDLEFLANIGHGYSISPETGNSLQIVGHGDVEDSYTTFDSGGEIDYWSSKHFIFYPHDEYELLVRTNNYWYDLIYEEGYGLVMLDAGAGEFGHFTALTGAIKSGDTTGVINASLYEEQINSFNLYPNPAADKVYFSQEFSSITVFDIFGKQISFMANPISEIPIDHLAAGTYVILGTTTAGEKKVARFLKL